FFSPVRGHDRCQRFINNRLLKVEWIHQFLQHGDDAVSRLVTILEEAWIPEAIKSTLFLWKDRPALSWNEFRLNGSDPRRRLCQKSFNDMAVYVSQTTIDSIVAPGQFRVINPQKAKHGCVDVINLRVVLAVERFVAPLIAFPKCDTTLDAASSQPV